MKELKLNQEVFDLYDSYVHNGIGRREFVERLRVYAVGGLTIPMIIAQIFRGTTGQGR